MQSLQRLRRVWRRTVGALFCCAALSAKTQIVIPSPTPVPINLNPLKPNIVAPGGVQGVAQSQNTSVTIRWYQPLLSASNPNARDATYFVVCLQDAATACTYGPSSTGVWSGTAVGSIFGRTPVTTSSPFTTGPAIIRGYNYSLTASIGSAFYNRSLAVRVGACAAAANGACTFATPLGVAFSSVDLVAENTGSFPNSSTEQHFFAQAKNLGTGDSGNMRSHLDVWQIELTQLGPGFPSMCQTDPNAPGLNLADDDVLVTSGGAKISVRDRRTTSGTIDTSGLDIVGIHRSNHFTQGVGGMLVSIPAGRTVGVVGVDIAVTRPMGFALILDVDDTAIVPEVDDANNHRADCEVIQ